jgi:hypothetical protein
MDDAWGWGILSGIAILVTGSMIGIAPSLIDRAPRLGWWCVILSPLPLIIWDVMWILMANPPDSWRRSISLIIGALAGAVILYGVSELLRSPASAQSPSSGPPAIGTPSVEQNNQGAPNFNVPGSGNQFNIYPPAAPPAPADQGVITQSGIVVGKVFGARRLPTDATTFEFVEITNCNQFNTAEPFYYGGVKLLLQSNQKRVNLDISRPQDGMIRGYVLAKVIE